MNARGMWQRIAALAVAVPAAALGGCGGGEQPSAPSAAGTEKAAIVAAADLDGDGRTDIVVVEADDRIRCWRHEESGDFAPRDDWPDHPRARDVRRDARGRPDTMLEADFGGHHAGSLPYVVLCVDREGAREGDVPLVRKILPEAGPPRALVLLAGRGLALRGHETRVDFGASAADVLFARPGFVLTQVPADLGAGTVDVFVHVGTRSSLAVPFEVLERRPPVLERVDPDPLVAGTFALLTGKHLGSFLDDVEVSFGGVVSERVWPFFRHAVARVPEGAESGPVTITVNGLVSNAVEAQVLSVFPVPRIVRVVPAAASSGSLVRVEGDGFLVAAGALGVTISGVAARPFFIAPSGIVVIVPDGITDGPVQVTVGAHTSNAVPLAVPARGAPAIETVAPDEGAPGTRVEIRGTDLHDLSGWGSGPPRGPSPFGDLVVRFGDESAFAFPVPGGLDAIVPSDASTGPLVVVVDGVASNPYPFTVR